MQSTSILYLLYCRGEAHFLAPLRYASVAPLVRPITTKIKDSELNSKFKIINSKSNNALAHAPLYYCIALHARMTYESSENRLPMITNLLTNQGTMNIK